MHPSQFVTLLCAVLALCGSGCRSRPQPIGDVIFVVVDTLRADRLGRYGNERGLTPFLDQLADRGVRFDHAYAPSSWTVPSIASLFTSRLPSQHQVSTFDTRLSDADVTVAERLSAAGYAAAGFTANFRLTAELGFAQGFPLWRGFINSPGSEPKARGEVLRAAALEWLDTPRQENAPKPPRLLYLQYMDTHAPFFPPQDPRARFAPRVSDEIARSANRKATELFPTHDFSPQEEQALRDLYDAEVAGLDAELRRLFEALEQRGILGTALVIVTADHGEEFLEHGNVGHGYGLFNETVHVPLIIAGPGITAGVVSENVSLIDLAPTLLDLAGLPPEARFAGRSLAPLLRGAAGEAPTPDVLLQLLRNHKGWDLRTHVEGLVRGDQKLLIPKEEAFPPELFDLTADPAELKPNTVAAATQPLNDALAAAKARLAAPAQPTAERAVIDDATQEKLRALGYGH